MPGPTSREASPSASPVPQEDFANFESPCPDFRPVEIHSIVDTVARYAVVFSFSLHSNSIQKLSGWQWTSLPGRIQSLTPSRYDANNARALAAYVAYQLLNGIYDKDANLALLKLLQFNPDELTVEVVEKVLVKAMTALPDPDFNLCLCLLSQDILANPSIVALVDLRNDLESCRFARFWTRVGGLAILDECVGFHDSIRDFIATTLSNTFQVIGTRQLASYVDLQSADLFNFIEEYGWSVDGDSVKIPVDRDIVASAAKPVVQQEALKFEALAKIIHYSNRI